MKYQFKFSRIQVLKEREKDEALASYKDSVKKFEEVAEKLYDLLKKKEDMEVYQSTKLQAGLPVQAIRQYQKYIANLEKTIHHYQKMVINARNRMNLYQEKLMARNIEVKKFEKIKEKDLLHFVATEKLAENKQMDDISIQHFMNRGS